jgi:protein-arginine kinase
LKSKREKFVDLANKRVTSAIDKIRLIGNLSDRRFYEYSEKDSKQIIDALTKELSSVKSKFQNNAKKKDKEFSLDL